jgi:3D (Asp-Asp-Asp) domain-containing protein
VLSLGVLLPLASVNTVQRHAAALEREANRGPRLTRWTQKIRIKTPPVVEHRLSLNLPPNASKVVSRGVPAIREKLLEFKRIPGKRRLIVRALATRVIQPGKPKIMLSGILAYDRYARLAKRGFKGAERFATAAVEMVATAYTPDCYGCSGITAIGLPAGRGIVAVDPSVIPLGTRLYIKGYGLALAGDTGGAIHGDRIDLGFESTAAAEEFGRRPVRVYVLKK